MKPEAAAPAAQIRRWLVEARLAPQVQENVERLAKSDDVRHVVLLPDIHLGRSVNNGCVVATSALVYPQAVGSDIGCGFSAIQFKSTADFLADDPHAAAFLRQLYLHVPALKQRGGGTLPAPLEKHALSDARLTRQARRDGAFQMGTLGCGNHFVELQRDDAGLLWVMIHSGSRAMGQVITAFHMGKAATSSTGLKCLDTRLPEGKAYLNDMDWATRYATLNRLTIMARIVELLEARFGIAADEESYVDCPHNFARLENHQGERFIVHRKSANSARAGEVGLVAGSMGTPSFIVHGLGSPESLCSSSHGAGRVLSRTEARLAIKPGDMRRQMGSVRHDPGRIAELRDEAPAAYRDIHEVMRAQHDLVRQRARLLPVLNFKYPDRRSP